MTWPGKAIGFYPLCFNGRYPKGESRGYIA